ncbi:MAG: hypothetical protein RL141_145 [Candidatus Parcubacteria bacterium]|jgi:hypothetical protein
MHAGFLLKKAFNAKKNQIYGKTGASDVAKKSDLQLF